MKKNLTVAVLPALSLLFVLAAVAFSFAASSTPTVTAQSEGSQPSGYSPLAWTGLLPVSGQPYYDNTSSIASSPLNAGITIAWEERDEGEAHSFGAIQIASNNSVGAPLNEQTVSRHEWKQIGNVVIRPDSLGRRHMTFYEYSGGSSTCGQYGMTDSAGTLSVLETIPGSCDGFYKRTALAVGPDNTVHIILGRDNTNLRYFQRNPLGQWVVQNEIVFDEANANDPSAPVMAVSRSGVVMAAWLQRPNGGGKYDVITGIRTAANAWSYENISASCCTGCSFDANTYSPALAAAPDGGIRAAWVEEQCNPRTDPRSTDLYYREWQAQGGWNNQPIVMADGTGGQQFWAGIDVDNLGVAHIAYASDNSRGRDNYTFAMVSGRGTSFTSPDRPFFSNGAFLKEPAVAHGPGYIFATFNSNYGAPQFKTIYYAYKDIPDIGIEPTATPTNTPTPIPPRCPDQRFTDVCPEDFFYEAVLELDELGVLGGYNSSPPCDGANHIPCFKPFNNITRAQSTKVIVLAANLPANLQGAPHFQDVPESNTFYTFIEYAYNAGVLTGYNCGGINEPCVPPANKPYFRPGNNVTRGQLAKMAAIAFNLNEPVTTQTFEDVPTSNPFHQYIERLAARGVIGGYNCGGAFEPCVPPGNRPYFRPNNNVTRGQAAKILYELVLITPTATATSIETSTAEVTATSTEVIATTTIVNTLTPETTSTAIIPTVTVVIPTVTVTTVAGR